MDHDDRQATVAAASVAPFHAALRARYEALALQTLDFVALAMKRAALADDLADELADGLPDAVAGAAGTGPWRRRGRSCPRGCGRIRP